ncbi:hypothetical protein BGZ65_002547 [Modicella reniformis]|uniref:Uncharacterized protein n=1 Tax=Modicella reniformis TaxID=1440133 RepID=A0A9P6LS57_9FUNG|nr:hypothetical protein BGZ65_002547 [Modicella reniformis]
MASIGYPPHDNLSPDQFYSWAIHESDPGRRRRLFADARQSTLCSHRVYLLAAEIEEHWGAEVSQLKVILAKGIVVFKNPQGQAGYCSKVSKATWLEEASTASTKTAAALRQAVAENLS